MDDLVILYGSETGDTEQLALDLKELCEKARLNVQCCSALDAVGFQHIQDIKVHYVVFVMSTTGDGEAPRNMTALWKEIRKKKWTEASLEMVSYALMGLGDSKYIKFNAIGKRFHTRLQQLGAKPMEESLVVFSDESLPTGHDAAFHQFSHALISYVTKQRKNQPDKFREFVERKFGVIVENLGVHEHDRDYDQTDLSKRKKWTRDLARSPSDAAVSYAEVVSMAKLTKYSKAHENPELDVQRDVRHLVLRYDPTQTPKYNPGDVVNIMPWNKTLAVEAFLNMFEWDGDQRIHAYLDDDGVAANSNTAETKKPLDLNIQQPCTLFQLVATHFDILCTPKRSVIRKLAPLATNSQEREKLEYFASTEGADDLIQYTYREKRTLLMVFRDFPSLRPSLKDLLLIVPRLRPRSFSIASSPTKHLGEIHICVSLVKYKTPLRRIRQGVCSAFFAELTPGDIVPFWFVPGSLKFPPFASEMPPIVMIGPGTGIAPFRSYLQECLLRSKTCTFQNILFFGCRNQHADYLYEREFQEFLDANVLQHLSVAFSRDTDHKIYVQHHIIQRASMIYPLLMNPATRIYVAGSSGNMPKDVKKAFEQVLVSCGGYSEQQANQFMNSWGTRYQVECWS